MALLSEASFNIGKSSRGVFVDLLNIDAASVESTPEKTVDDFSYVLKLESENASRHLITVNGNAQLDGDSALELAGGGGPDYLSFPSASPTDMVAGTGDWTFQSYIYVPSAFAATSDVRRIFTNGDILSENGAFTIGVGSFTSSWTGRRINIAVRSGGAVFEYFSEDIPVGVFTFAEWHHLAVVVSSGIIRFYFDGNEIRLAKFNSTAWANGTPIAESVGVDSTSYVGMRPDTEFFIGKLSRMEYALTARWTAPFTPPNRLDALAVDSDTAFAPSFEGDAASTRILDTANPVDAQSIGILPDTSGNERDAVQSTVGNQPTFNDTLQALAFDGINDYLAGTLVQAQPLTVYFIADIAASVAAKTFFGDINVYMQLGVDEYFSAYAGLTVTDSNDRSGGKKVFAVEFNGASSVLYVNGATVASGNLGTNALAAFGIGSRNDGNNPSPITFHACFIQSDVYNLQLNMAIKNKYGI